MVGMADQSCELCSGPGGALLWQSEDCRVIRVDDRHYPGFCRVVWNAHVREMSDLDPDDRLRLMRIVIAVERVVRELFFPDKINLASFGNMVPHLHWHIIPRWVDDRHFPEPIWGAAHREGLVDRPAIDNEQMAQALSSALADIE